MKRTFLYIFFLLLFITGFAQQINLSDQSEISVITVDPGSNLYDSFGHSAFRVKDNTLRIDQAYNYGMFDFNKPNFYSKFAQGKLLYDLAAYPFPLFYQSYAEEERGIREQILNLTTSEKQAFFNFLENNAKPENKSYYYDFFYDNCATKLKDVAENVLEQNVDFKYDFIQGKEETLRSLIHQYTKKNHPWGTFGIDLALGSVIDKKATAKDFIFLPDNIFKMYAESAIHDKPIVKETNILFRSKENGGSFKLFTPTTLFSLLALLVLWITYRDLKHNKRSKWLDFSLFLFTGIIGTVVLLLWFATNHAPTKDNFNFLWAFMPNLLVAFTLLKNNIPNWVRYYVVFLMVLILLTVLIWIFKIQDFAVGIIPLLILLSVRYWFLIKRSNEDLN